MKAKLPKSETSNARELRPKREMTHQNTLVTVHKGDIIAPITVRWYMGRSTSANREYCSIWVRCSDGRSYSGHGWAGGYGYDKQSASLAEAIESAGIELTTDNGRSAYIAGAGDIRIRDALIAIARAAGYRGKLRIV